MDHSAREQEVQGSIPDLVVPEMYYTSLINAKHVIIRIALAPIYPITPLKHETVPPGISDRKG